MAPGRRDQQQQQAVNEAKKALEVDEKQLKRQFGLLDQLLQAEPKDIAAITRKMSVVEINMKDYVHAWKTFNGYLLAAGDDNLLEEQSNKKSDNYEELTRFREAVQSLSATAIAATANAAATTSVSESYRLRLPERKFQQFDGDVRNWSNFWASFEEIDKDKRIPAIEKYHLLLGAMVPDSRPYITVSSHVAAPDSYEIARDELKDKFGRPKTIIKVYIRDLLKIVVDNCGPRKMEFTHMVTTLTAMLRNLNKLGVNEANSGVILYAIVESCIPREMLDRYLQIPDAKEEVNDIMTFLNNEVKRYDETQLAQESFDIGTEKRSHRPTQPIVNKVPTATNFMNSTDKSMSKCGFCNFNHATVECRKVFRMTLEERRTNLKKSNTCFKCLKHGHFSKQCKANIKCALCQRGHYAILCPESEQSEETEESQENSAEVDEEPPKPVEQPKQGPSKKVGYANYVSKPEVLLQTFRLNVHGQKGTRVVRGAFDSCNQSSYITTRLWKDLGFPSVGKERVIHQTFGGNLSDEVEHPVVTVEVSGLTEKYKHRCYFDVSVQDTLGRDIIAPANGPWNSECEELGIFISDLGRDRDEIDILIGNDVSPYLREGQQSIWLPCGLVATESKLGWFLEGKIPSTHRKKATNKAMMCINMMQCQLDASQLWSLDTIGIRDSPISPSMSEREQTALDYFHSTVKQDETGRFIVHLPWVDNHPQLPNNRNVAVARLHKTTQDLIRDGKLDDYNMILNRTWPEQGITEIVPDNKNGSILAHYLPHRAVYKEGSTTPVRPVFNASCRSKNQPSLNDCLEVGPNLLELIPSKLMDFRRDQVGVISDIAKAFLQILVAEKDRDNMRFLWWESPNMKNIVEFRHCRVVFGVTSSPFLLSAVIKILLEQNKESFPDAVARLQRCLYVDNVVTSFATREDAQMFQKEATFICAKGQFNLRDWEIGTCLEERKASVLGMIWDRQDDGLMFDLKNFTKKSVGLPTKRSVLALAATVFDPLGVLSPVLIPAKIIFKNICLDSRKIGWDDKLPDKYCKDFDAWTQQIPHLEKFKIPRKMSTYSDGEWSVHVFADASKEAYACAVYLRVNGSPVEVQLLQARARVTPTKPKVSIPRAELLACLIAARLTVKVLEDLRKPDVEVSYYSDSSAAVTWIVKDGNWATFVANRVNEIRRLTNRSRWFHIPGVHNPADLPSRGVTVEKMMESCWLNGPEWLHSKQDDWPITRDLPLEYPAEVEKEMKKTVMNAMVVTQTTSQFFEKLLLMNSYEKIIRFLAFMIRYIKKKFNLTQSNGGESTDGKISPPTAEEIQNAEEVLIRHVQKATWNGQQPKGLNCKLDKKGIWRVITKMVNTEESECFLRPAVLPGNNKLVRLLIQDVHARSCHAGTQYLQGILREKYWIVNNRRSVRNAIHKCPACFRINAKKCSVEEAPLPAARTTLTRCFDVIGVDLAGPLFLRNGDKCWVVIFTCAVYRAVHFELVLTLSTSGFLLAFGKFVSRRGRPTTVYSDNGTNFRGTANLFAKVDWKKVQHQTAMEKITWIFNTPSAPWWGGFWERIVGLMKQLLRRNLGKRILDFVELDSVVTDVEAVINDRPLTYVSEDPDDLRPITPAMFLKDLPVSTLPEMEVTCKELNRRMKYINDVKIQLRQRFRSEYLSQLISKPSVKSNSILKPGDVVLVESDNKKFWEWPLAVVQEVYSGRDGHLRTAKVKTANGVFLRPFQRLRRTEIADNEDIVFQSIPEVNGIDSTEPEVDIADDVSESGDVNENSEEPVVITKSGRRILKPIKLGSSIPRF